MNDHLIRLLLIDGFLGVEKTKKANIKPTPIATPVKHIIGILEAKYLNPINIINKNSSINSKLSSIHTMLLELNDTNPNIRNNDISNSSSNIRKWNMTIQ